VQRYEKVVDYKKKVLELKRLFSLPFYVYGEKSRLFAARGASGNCKLS
jgi:hypothetical protein